MLARSGSLPTRGCWAYEVKWDGFRAIVRTGDDYRVRSRRGWDMTVLVPELRALPPRACTTASLSRSTTASLARNPSALQGLRSSSCCCLRTFRTLGGLGPLPGVRGKLNLVLAGGWPSFAAETSAQARGHVGLFNRIHMEVGMVTREPAAAAEVLGEFISSDLHADCTRFLQQAQALAARRREQERALAQRSLPGSAASESAAGLSQPTNR